MWVQTFHGYCKRSRTFLAQKKSDFFYNTAFPPNVVKPPKFSIFLKT